MVRVGARVGARVGVRVRVRSIVLTLTLTLTMAALPKRARPPNWPGARALPTRARS